MKDRPLKIVHLSGMMNRGGGENHILNLTEGLLQLDQNSTVFCPQNSQLALELKEKGLPSKSTKLNFKADPTFFLIFGRYCRKNKVDIVHVHDPVAMFLILLSSYFFRLPAAVLSKKTSFPIKKRKRTIYKYNHPIFKRVICVSKEVARVTKLSIQPASKITTIYNGSNLSQLAALEPEFDIKSRLNLEKDTKLIVHIANHTKPKDLPTLIKVVEKLKNRTDIHFVQIGRHTERGMPFLQEVKDLGLDNRISFLGELQHASVYLKQADISLITSKSEGLPQVVYESMFYKVPIVSTVAGGIPEVIENNESGFLADIGDADALVNHIKRILDKDIELEKMLSNNYDLVKSKYDSKIMAKKTLELYKEVLQTQDQKK